MHIDRDMRNQIGYANTHASDRYVEAVMKSVRHMANYKIMHQMVAHDVVDRIYCRFLLPKINEMSQFYRLAELLLNKHKTILLIPEDDAPWKIRDNFNLKGSMKPYSVEINKTAGNANRLRMLNTLAGGKASDWIGEGITQYDILPYQVPTEEELETAGVRAVFMGNNP